MKMKKRRKKYGIYNFHTRKAINSTSYWAVWHSSSVGYAFSPFDIHHKRFTLIISTDVKEMRKREKSWSNHIDSSLTNIINFVTLCRERLFFLGRNIKKFRRINCVTEFPLQSTSGCFRMNRKFCWQ